MTTEESEFTEIVCEHCNEVIAVENAEVEHLLGCPHCFMKLGVADEEEIPPERQFKAAVSYLFWTFGLIVLMIFIAVVFTLIFGPTLVHLIYD